MIPKKARRRYGDDKNINSLREAAHQREGERERRRGRERVQARRKVEERSAHVTTSRQGSKPGMLRRIIVREGE